MCSYRYSCKIAEDDSFDMFSDLENVKIINNQSTSLVVDTDKIFFSFRTCLGLLVWTGQLDQLHTFTIRKEKLTIKNLLSCLPQIVEEKLRIASNTEISMFVNSIFVQL